MVRQNPCSDIERQRPISLEVKNSYRNNTFTLDTNSAELRKWWKVLGRKSEYSFFPVKQQAMLWLIWICECVYVLLLIMHTWLRGSRFRSLQDLYIRSEKWYRTLRRVFSTSELQSLRALYCGGTDWGKPSWIPEQPAKYRVRVVDEMQKQISHPTAEELILEQYGSLRRSETMEMLNKMNYARIQQKNIAYLNCVYYRISIHFDH